MKLSIKHSFVLKPLVALLFFVLLDSCKKTDSISESLSSDAASSSKAQHAVPPRDLSADVVYQWYHFMSVLQRPVNPQPSPFQASRAFAYIGIGLFESVQPGISGGHSFGGDQGTTEGNKQPKLIDMPAMPKTDPSKEYLWSASANSALASMFKLFLAFNLSPADKASIDANELATYNQLKLTTSEDVLQRSQAFGRSIASAIWDWSTSDNFSITSGTYIPLNEPWAYVTTPPNNPTAVGDNLQYSRPLLKFSVDATAPPIPVPFSEVPNSEFYNAVKEIHDLGGTLTATAANKATANWWADAGGPGVGLPAPYHILSVVTSVLESQHAGLAKAAEVYAKTGIAIKDAPIIVFRAKYHYNLLRPITYIRRNIDANWFSHLTTPPYPEYSSGLVGFYGPVTQVLINEFGDIPVTDDTYSWNTPARPARHYNKISELRLEAALSRVYAGIHYRFTQMTSIDMGIELGNEIDKVRVVGPEYK